MSHNNALPLLDVGTVTSHHHILDFIIIPHSFRLRDKFFSGEYPSKNVWEDAKAFSNSFSDRNWMDSFIAFSDATVVFDDPKINLTTVLTTLQQWNVIISKYADTYDPETLLMIFLEGSRFMTASTPEDDARIPGCDVCLSQRQATSPFVQIFQLHHVSMWSMCSLLIISLYCPDFNSITDSLIAQTVGRRCHFISEFICILLCVRV